MPRPIVEIYQSVANVTLTPSNPTLPLCLVGPAYKLLQYPTDRALKHAYGPRGGWDDPFTFNDHGNWNSSDLPGTSNDAIPYSTFGFAVGTNVVDTSSVAVYLENVYHNLVVAGEKNEIRNCTIADGRVIETDGDNLSDTVPPGGLKAGDVVYIAPHMPQVLYDDHASSAFLSTASVGDTVTYTSVSDGDKTLVVRAVIDDHRLLLTDNVGGFLDGLNGAIVETKQTYVLNGTEYTSRAQLVRPTPEERVVQEVTGVYSFKIAKDVKFVTTDNRRSQAHLRFERRLPASTNGTAPGHLLSDNVSAGDTSFTVGDTGAGNYITLSVSGSTVSVMRADILLSARGLIINKPDFMTFSSIPSDLDFPNIGKAHPDNPLGLAVYIALSNAGGNTVQALAIASDDAAGYAAALPKLNSHDTVYAIVPLSTDIPNVIAPFKNAAVAMSAPAKGRFRHVIGASAGLPAYKFVSATLGGETGTGEWAAGEAFHDDNATFKTDGVVAGDLVVVTRMAGVTKNPAVSLTVASVPNEQNLVLTGHVGAVVGTDWEYTVQRSISSDSTAQVAALLARIANVGSNRLTMVYPGECKVLGHSSLPGYYLAAAVGAMVSAFAPHRPKNQIGLAAIEQIYDSNLHFSYDEIDALSDGGYFVLQQDSTEGLAYCVHQLTTGQIGSPGVQEYCELSVVNNFDYVSLVIKRRLSPFVGVWNMIPEAYGSVRSTLDSAILSLKSQSEYQIGAPVLDGSVDSIAKSDADSGTMIIKVGVSIPKVLNRLQVFLESQ